MRQSATCLPREKVDAAETTRKAAEEEEEDVEGAAEEEEGADVEDEAVTEEDAEVDVEHLRGVAVVARVRPRHTRHLLLLHHHQWKLMLRHQHH
jgi:hypothetical protein